MPKQKQVEATKPEKDSKAQHRPKESDLDANNVMHRTARSRKNSLSKKHTTEHVGKNLRIVADKIHATNIGEHLGEIGDQIDLNQKMQPFLSAFESKQPERKNSITEQ